MSLRYSKHFLNKLEDLIAETDYILRYERGNFTSGWCILNDTKVIIVNKFFATDGKNQLPVGYYKIAQYR
ncbi:MAG: hypothetical protein RLO12_04765 [Fulvivirga sp.]